MKKIILFLLALIVLLLTQTASFAVNYENAAPVLLTVYLDDLCGGCSGSVNTIGCGDCKDTAKLHAIIKKQLGDRLYDGTIEYRMLNTRVQVNEETRLQWAQRYDVPAESRHIRPAAYIGWPETGVYLLGDEAMVFVREALDRLVRGEDAEAVQRDMTELFRFH